MEQETEAMRVLNECIELMRTKANDYQNKNSTVVQADHYRRGIDTIFDTMNGKMLRIQSLLEASAAGVTPKHESIEDSLKDLINYASFGVSWLRGKMEGQKPDRDMFNKPTLPRLTNLSADPIGPAPSIKMIGIGEIPHVSDKRV